MGMFKAKDIAALLARSPGAVVADAPKPKRPVPTGMNKLEQAYARRLDVLKAAGEVAWWSFNAVKLRIADGQSKAFYKPDFAVLFSTGRLEFHETKGHWREAARLRIKVASGLYPFDFVAVQRRRQGRDVEWEYERFVGVDAPPRRGAAAEDR